jgi:hypothetical protein
VTTLSKSDDLHWLAFRYAAGEMSAEEEQGFELRLADDQQAREAVEQAVELSEAVRMAAAETPAIEPARQALLTYRRAAWAATAACLLLAVCGVAWLVNSILRSTPPSQTIGASNGVDRNARDASIALEWAALRGRQDAAAPESWIDSGPLDVENDTEAIAVAQADSELPEWLMTAVAGDADVASDADPPQENP